MIYPLCAYPHVKVRKRYLPSAPSTDRTTNVPNDTIFHARILIRGRGTEEFPNASLYVFCLGSTECQVWIWEVQYVCMPFALVQMTSARDIAIAEVLHLAMAITSMLAVAMLS